jgi:hypothetical protein
MVLQANPSSSQLNANRHDNNKWLTDRWMHLFSLPQAPQPSNTYLMNIISHWCKRTWERCMKYSWRQQMMHRNIPWYFGNFPDSLSTHVPQQLPNKILRQFSPALVTSMASYKAPLFLAITCLRGHLHGQDKGASWHDIQIWIFCRDLNP